MTRTIKEYAVHVPSCVHEVTTKALLLLPIYESEGHKVGLRRHITRQGEVFDETVLDVKHVGPNARFTIGVVKKQLTPLAMQQIKNCERLTIKMDDDIPLITYFTAEGECSERLQRLERDGRPKIAWVELVRSDSQGIPGTAWRLFNLAF